jgi:Xaa-Pro aminopeptidase
MSSLISLFISLCLCTNVPILCCPNSETRLYGHGQGYDLVERPAIRDDEPMKIQAGMNITIHPFAINKEVWAPVTDNYLVTETGEYVWIHKFPKEIIVI